MCRHVLTHISIFARVLTWVPDDLVALEPELHPHDDRLTRERIAEPVLHQHDRLDRKRLACEDLLTCA